MAQSVEDYAELNQQVFDAQNKARQDPGSYVSIINEEADDFVFAEDGTITNTMCLSPDFETGGTQCNYRMGTNEGQSAWIEASDFMGSQDTRPTYASSEGLAQACYDHISDTGPKGATGHTGSDGSSPFDRMDVYVNWMGLGENLAYGSSNTGEDVISQFIVDDGVSSRGHRNNIMSDSHTHAGVSCGCHANYGTVCCIAYGKSITEKDTTLVAHVAPRLDTCSEYDPTAASPTDTSSDDSSDSGTTNPNEGSEDSSENEGNQDSNQGSDQDSTTPEDSVEDGSEGTTPTSPPEEEPTDDESENTPDEEDYDCEVFAKERHRNKCQRIKARLIKLSNRLDKITANYNKVSAKYDTNTDKLNELFETAPRNS